MEDQFYKINLLVCLHLLNNFNWYFFFLHEHVCVFFFEYVSRYLNCIRYNAICRLINGPLESKYLVILNQVWFHAQFNEYAVNFADRAPKHRKN